jgi:hypothetical protein
VPTTRSLPLREEKLTPLNSDDEQELMSEDQKRALAHAQRKAKADSRGLPAPSRFEGAGEQPQKSSQMTTRSQAKGNEGDQRVSTELVPARTVHKRNLRGRAELEARDLWSVQGKWVRVCLKGTLPEPAS